MSRHVAVIGGGPGGYAAAFYAADLGMQVTLIDNEKNPGGVCLYRGCIPSKALLHVGFVITEAASLAEHGVAFGAPKFDFAKLRAHKDAVVKKLTGGLRQLIDVAERDHLAGFPDQERRIADVRDNAGDAAGHGFTDRIRESLTTGRGDDDVAPPVDLGHIVRVLEQHAVLDQVSLGP